MYKSYRRVLQVVSDTHFTTSIGTADPLMRECCFCTIKKKKKTKTFKIII